MFAKILNSLLKPVTACVKSSISDAWHGFEFAFPAINYSSKKVLPTCLLNLINILYQGIHDCAPSNPCDLIRVSWPCVSIDYDTSDFFSIKVFNALRARYTQRYSENIWIIQYCKNIFKCNMVKNIFKICKKITFLLKKKISV